MQSSMILVRWIVRILRKLRESRIAQWTTRSIIHLLSFLLRFNDWRAVLRDTSRPPTGHNTKDVFHFTPSEEDSAVTSLETISKTICASRLPDANFLPFPNSNPSASSYYRFTPSSVQEYSLRRAQYTPSANWLGDSGLRIRSNQHIDLGIISGYPSISAPGQPSASRHTSIYHSMHGSRSRTSVTPSMLANRESNVELSTIQEQNHPLPEPIEMPEDRLLISRAYERFRPISPTEHPRYDRETYVSVSFLSSFHRLMFYFSSANEDTTYELPPLTLNFQTYVEHRVLSNR